MSLQDKNTLLDGLERYGYGLLRPMSTESPEDVLTALAKQDDPRLLEGFPVVLYNGLRERTRLSWEQPSKNTGEKFPVKHAERFAFLLALSYLVFKLFGIDSAYVKRTKKLMSHFPKSRDVLAKVTDAFMKSDEFPLGNTSVSTDRLKRNFRQYVLNSGKEQVVAEKVQALELELLLSELFTTRQKDLLKKRLAGEAMTKTEREYFYRVVKKRLRALANEDLHRLARRLV